MTALSDRVAAEHQAGLHPVNGGVESRCSCGDTSPVTAHLVAVTERAVRAEVADQLERRADRHTNEAARHRADSTAAVTDRGTRTHMATAKAHRNKAAAMYDAARIAAGEEPAP